MPDESTLPGALISVLLNWFPFLLLVGVWLFVCWRIGAFRRGAMSQSRYLQEILDETKQQNAILAALLTKVDARLSQLEAPARDAKKLDA
jgi:ATP-dependent Zn protease